MSECNTILGAYTKYICFLFHHFSFRKTEGCLCLLGPTKYHKETLNTTKTRKDTYHKDAQRHHKYVKPVKKGENRVFFSCLHYAEVKNGQNNANNTDRLEHLQGQADNFLLSYQQSP